MKELSKASRLRLSCQKADFKHRPIFAYVDNNSARDVAISGKARNVGSLVSLLLAVEDLSGIHVWASRVLSPYNPADILSRKLVSFTEHGQWFAATFLGLKLSG